MDGPGLRHITLRVEHDCPMARLSAEIATAEFHCWSGHRLEVVEVRCPALLWPRVVESARRHVKPVRVWPSPDGGVLVWEPHVSTQTSISRILEKHDTMWLQPMRVAGGWEHYDAIAFGSGGEKEALAELSKSWPTQVVRRRNVGTEDLLASLFLSLRPALEAPTRKQVEALVAAARRGYYESPRRVTTAEVAQGLGIGRSAFEERLRGGENRIVATIVQALEHQRLGET